VIRNPNKTTSPQTVKDTADNLVLVPASLLPFKGRWGQLAGAVASREALFIVPDGETRLKQVMRRLVPELRARPTHHDPARLSAFLNAPRAASAVIVKLDAPAPRRTVLGVPPGGQYRHLPAGQDHQAAEIVRRGPAILAQYPAALDPQAGHRELLPSASGMLPAGDRAVSAVAHRDRQGGRGGMDPEDLRGV